MSFPALTTLDGLDESHYMLLHMVYLYSEASRGDNRWVRETPLLVLMYEGITKDVFDYDYAPASVKVGRRRVYMNVTQEGRDDLDDLREAGLLLSLKLTNNLNNNLTAFRLSELGMHTLLESGLVKASVKRQVEDFLRLGPGPQGLKRVRWTGDEFEVYCPGTGYSEMSEVTECEDVSYVTSPYVPACMRECQFPEGKSNTSRAHEAGEGAKLINLYLKRRILYQNHTKTRNCVSKTRNFVLKMMNLSDEFHDKATVTMARVQLLLSEKRLTVAEAEAIRQELLEEFKDSSADFSTLQKMELSKLRGR